MPYTRQEAALLLSALLAVPLLAGCAGSNGAAEPEAREGGVRVEESEPTMTIEQVLERRAPELMRLQGVVGVGQGVCAAAPCIRVYIVADSIAAGLPPRLDGYRVDPVVTGRIQSGE